MKLIKIDTLLFAVTQHNIILDLIVTQTEHEEDEVFLVKTALGGEVNKYAKTTHHHTFSTLFLIGDYFQNPSVFTNKADALRNAIERDTYQISTMENELIATKNHKCKLLEELARQPSTNKQK